VTPTVVSNSSPLIALERIGQLPLLEQLFGSIWVPPAVVQEVVPGLNLPAWVVERGLGQPLAPIILGASLGPGESEALALALEANARWVIVDDLPARRLGQALGLPVIGTLGILLASKRRGLLPAVQPSLDALIRAGFHIAPQLYDQVLATAGEGP
jgi:predicted nucleic acid-binding protein